MKENATKFHFTLFQFPYTSFIFNVGNMRQSGNVQKATINMHYINMIKKDFHNGINFN